MASNPPGNCCTQGVLHTGQTYGHFDNYAGVDVYVTGDPASDKLLILCPDIWSIQKKNTQIMADNFAKQGYVVVAPDFFFGDPYTGTFPSDNLWEWLKGHMPETKIESTHKLLAHSKEKFNNVQFVAAVGYCYGAALVVDLLGHALIDVGAVAHPSLVTSEALERIQRPLIISAAETDSIFPPELRAKTEQILTTIKATYYLELFSGVSHGYAVRGDPNDKWVAACADRTFASQLWYFNLFKDGIAKQNYYGYS